MNRLVAMEDGLSSYRRHLEDRGYQVVGMDPENMRRAQAVVVSGIDDRFLGMADIDTEKRVVLAAGLTPAEVESRIQHLERVHLGPDNDGQGR